MRRRTYLIVGIVGVLTGLLWRPQPVAVLAADESAQATPLAIDPVVAEKARKKLLVTKTSIDGPRDVPETGVNCTENRCKTAGCATCGEMKVHLPLTASVVAVRCYSTANYPDGRCFRFPAVPIGRGHCSNGHSSTRRRATRSFAPTTSTEATTGGAPSSWRWTTRSRRSRRTRRCT
jgi:hypothetical protein